MSASPYCRDCELENPPGADRCVMCERPLHGATRASEGPTRRMQPETQRRRPPGRVTTPFQALSSDEKQALAKSPPPRPAATRPPPGGKPKGPIHGWLACPPFRPIPVGPKPVIRIGRSRECDLILPHASVSRQHVSIRALGTPVVEDRSTYGTWLNGKRIVSAELKPGDALTVGPYEIVFRAKGALDKEQGEEETRPFTVPASTEAMQGRLDKVSLPEVLQQIEFYKKTGTLRVFTDDFDGRLVVYDGSPIYAEAEGKAVGLLEDAEVVYTMLAMKKGNFSFLSKVEAGDLRMSGQTLTALLLEGNRRNDETATGSDDLDAWLDE